MGSAAAFAGVVEPATSSPSRKGLYLSLVVILGYWGYDGYNGFRQFLRLNGTAPFSIPGIRVIALQVCVWAAVSCMVAWLLLYISREKLSDLGLRWRDLRYAVPRALLIMIGLFLIESILLPTALSALITDRRTATGITDLFRDPSEIPYWIAACLGAGVGEELRRAFVLTRFGALYGRAGLVVALLIDSFIFGLGHLYQGIPGAVTVGCTGLIYGLIFLRWRRLADVMIAHAGGDLLAAALVFAFQTTRL